MRSLTRWEPTSDLNTLATRMDRLFDELMGRGVAWLEDPSNEQVAFERVRLRRARAARSGSTR